MGKVTNPIILGRRNCSRCARWRHTTDFRWRWRAKYDSRSRRLKSRRETPVVDTVCISCRRIEDHEKYVNLTVEQKRAITDRQKETRRKRQDKRRAIWEDQVRYAKMVVHTPKANHDNPSYDLVPFRMWLLGAIRRHGSIRAFAKLVGVDEAKVRKLADGYEWIGGSDEPTPIQGVRLSTVDKFAVGVGDPDLVNRLYPYVEPPDEG